MGRYITTKADFTLRRKHKKGPSGTTIYENDYTTINPMPNALKGEYVIGDSNFIFTSRLGINAQKKHVRGKFIPPVSGSVEDKIAWTIENMPDSGITNETKIRLKPNYTSIKDFACYGSAVKLVQGTVNGVITDFPAEMYLSNEQITFYAPDSGCAGYSFNEENAFAYSGNILYNEYAIDITTANIRPETVYNPLRYFTLCGSSYNYIDANGNAYDFSGFTVTSTASGTCYQGKSVWVDKLAEVIVTFTGASGTKKLKISIFKDNQDETVYYTYVGVPKTSITSGGHIKPKKEIVEDYFRDCDDFTGVLLERTANPIYTSTFETPRETETGYVYDMVSYTWPTLLGGYNPDLSGPYFSYVEGLMHLAEFYDEFFSDNMWRSLTHEAIKTLDWTYVSNTDGDVQDMSTIDTSRIEPITKIYGRQFDDLKRYADGIKSINTITYNQKSNTPDYTLTDVLENSGWETKTLKITSDNDICTKPLYPGLNSGHTSSDANNEFLRRMKLNSQYLFSVKGTRKGLDSMLGMFGFTPYDYTIKEYVYVFTGSTFPHFCSGTSGNNYVAYPLAKDVSTINKYKVNFNAFDPYGDYCGIPVAEIGYFPSGETGPDCSYVVPWFSYGKNYDDGLYFQKHGGWGKRKEMDVELEIAPSVSSITSCGGAVPLYTETQARLKFAKDFDELLQQAYASSNVHDVSYVTDISRIEDLYTSGYSQEITGASHYFVLENEDMNQFLGWSVDAGKYGWRSIAMSEIQTPSASTAGTLVLYLESIKDDTTGNNPHIGNGTYDDGMSYISGMSEVFAYSLVNKNFIGIDDSTCSEIKKIKFGVEKYEDNRKCWFFTDNYNKKGGKEATCGSGLKNIEFREVDISDAICELENCNDSRINTGGGCDSGLAFDVATLLSSASGNQSVNIGSRANASSHFITETPIHNPNFNPNIPASSANPRDILTGATKLYGRTSGLITFDPEKKRNRGDNGEAQANSIVNVKNLDVSFNIPSGFSADDKTAFRQYVETSVIPYLTQMIPSTSILSWSFSGDTSGERPTPPPKPPVPSAETYTYELQLHPILENDCLSLPSVGTSCFTLDYVTKNSSGTEVSRVDVTTTSRWMSNDTSIVTITDGDDGGQPIRCINGRNEDPVNEVSTTVAISYPNGQASPKVVNVTVGTANTPTISLEVNTPIDATATTLSYTAICDTNVIVKYGGITSNYKIGTFAVPQNTTQNEVPYTISAICADYPYVWTDKTITQKPGHSTDPTISLAVNPDTLPAAGGTVIYKVTVNPASTNIKVKCELDETDVRTSKNGTFMLPANTEQTGRTYTISAWCADNPSIIDTKVITQDEKADFWFVIEEEFYFVIDDNDGEFYFIVDDDEE